MTDWTVLHDELKPLSWVFSGPEAQKYLELFEQLLSVNEFGVALDTVCDYLIEFAIVPDARLLEQLDRLHGLMEIEDDCLARLKSLKGPT
jgi:hypothetical protein